MEVSEWIFFSEYGQGPFFSFILKYPGSNIIWLNVIYLFYGLSAMNVFIFWINVFRIIAQSSHKRIHPYTSMLFWYERRPVRDVARTRQDL